MDEVVARKLGVREDRTFAIVDPPSGFDRLAGGETPDVLLVFVADAAAVMPALEHALARYRTGAALWFAYPKKSGTLASDITRDSGWGPMAAAGLLPVSQIAIDADWSALRFRFRDEIAKLTRRQDLPGTRP